MLKLAGVEFTTVSASEESPDCLTSNDCSDKEDDVIQSLESQEGSPNHTGTTPLIEIIQE